MAGVYAQLCGFALAHRRCAGPRRADVSLATPSGYSLIVRCGCGQEFTRWVTPEDADEDLLRSALLAFENQVSRSSRVPCASSQGVDS